MTTYVLGAGASKHAGYPLCSELWTEMNKWAETHSSEDLRGVGGPNRVAAVMTPLLLRCAKTVSNSMSFHPMSLFFERMQIPRIVVNIRNS
jgi:hypothetical protein